MKLLTLLLLALIVFTAIAQGDGTDGAAGGDGAGGDGAGGDGGAAKEADPNAKVNINMKKSKRRTPNEILNAISSEPTGILEMTIYLKTDSNNVKSKK